jgi:hypothetical protein
VKTVPPGHMAIGVPAVARPIEKHRQLNVGLSFRNSFRE